MNQTCNVVRIDTYAKKTSTYGNCLKEFVSTLDAMGSMCHWMATNLAATGKWKEWDKSMPIGSTFDFDEGMLLKTGDELVTRITQLSIDISDIVEQINIQLDDRADYACLLNYRGQIRL